MKTPHRFTWLVAAAALMAALPTVQATQPVRGEKIDSGLGQLPPYAQWDDKTGRQPVRQAVAGESLDDGLGELPHFSKWLDRSGRDPMGLGTLNAAATPR